MSNDSRAKSIAGVIANPAASSDIRRIVGNATGIPLATRANLITRLLVGLGSVGVEQVFVMPDRNGLGTKLTQALNRERALSNNRIPMLEFLDMPVEGATGDSVLAAKLMIARGASVLIVFGGDGTHRAVASVCGDVPLAGVSTGTNNAFPKFHEPTIVGQAAGLVVRGIVPASVACNRNKRLRVCVNGDNPSIALVDVAVTTDRWVGARALWKPENLSELYLTFAEPTAVGLSAIGGALHPLGRGDKRGLKLRLGPPESSPMRVRVPIMPGSMTEVGVLEFEEMCPGESYKIGNSGGVIALDGEREVEFDASAEVAVFLDERGPVTINVERVMQWGSSRAALVHGRA